MDELQIERRFWLALSICEGIGPVRFHKLLHHFGSAKMAWNASLEELKKVIGEKTAERLADFREEFSLEEYEARLQKLQVSYSTLPEKKYPQLLKNIKK